MLDVIDLNLVFSDHLLPETVVHHLNLHMEEGDIVGLVGESGSGKSMTALGVAGLLRRHDLRKTGQILFRGMDLLTCPRSQLRSLQGNEIGIVFQEPMTSLNPAYRIGWQVEESLRIHRPEMDKEERRKRAIEMLKAVELDEPQRIYASYPHQISGGQRQRVMIAAAMICEPALLIADEPTTALDVTIQLAIVRLLKKLNREKKTAILFISHDLSLVKRLCDRVVVMKDGRIVEEGEIDEVFYHPKQEYTQKLIAAIPDCIHRAEKEDTADGSEREKEEAGEKEKCVHPDFAPILEVEDLNVSYFQDTGKLFGAKEDLHVLKGVSFSIGEGEVLGLVGESGCGKSTLSRAILGLLPRYDGRIQNQAERAQMIFQDPYSSLNPSKKVGWILEEPLKLNTKLGRTERRRKVARMLERVGLEEKIAERYPRQLSGGQRQRVCIAESLMLEPKLLIADEPVSALDVTIQAQILELLQEIQKEMGLSILFISHDMRVVYQMSQRVMVMKDGRIVESGEVDEVYFHPKHPYTKMLLEAADIQAEGEE